MPIQGHGPYSPDSRFNVPIEGITPGFFQVGVQFSIINSLIALEIEVFFRHTFRRVS